MLKSCKNYIILPATVRLEYEKHKRGEFSKMEKRIEEASKETAKQIETAKSKIINSCHSLERLQYQDVDDLKINLSEKIDAVKSDLIIISKTMQLLDLFNIRGLEMIFLKSSLKQ